MTDLSNAAALDLTQQSSIKNTAALIYSLQAAAFFVGITFIAAVIICYIKRDDTEGTWLASHFRWQIRTFWFSLLWTVIGSLTFFFIIGYFILLINVVWTLYRVIKGWLRLSENKPMYASATTHP